jgi:FemAB-related protein (PEP-CTERM system-associated)
MLVSTPAAIYGGPVADDEASAAALVAEARRLARDLGVDYLELRDPGLIAGRLSYADFLSRDLYVTFDRALPGDADELLPGFPKKIRYQIRRAMQLGLTATLGGVEVVDDFYEAYATNMRHLGTPVYPKRLFLELLRAFPDASDILIARQGRHVAGATLNLYFGDTVLPHYGCAYPQLHSTGVSAFMYWQVMCSAIRRGYRSFDFGRSKVHSGSWTFKRGWRLHERPLPYRYLLVRARQMPNLQPANPRFSLAIRAWKHLPLQVTKRLGPVVVRGIP